MGRRGPIWMPNAVRLSISVRIAAFRYQAPAGAGGVSQRSFTQALIPALVNAHKPEILLLGATTLSRDLAGSVATTGNRPDRRLYGAQHRRRRPLPVVSPGRPLAEACCAPSSPSTIGRRWFTVRQSRHAHAGGSAGAYRPDRRF